MEFDDFSCVVFDETKSTIEYKCLVDSFEFRLYKVDSNTICIRLMLDDYLRQTKSFISSKFTINTSALHKDFYGVIAKVAYTFCIEEINKIEIERKVKFERKPNELEICNALIKFGFHMIR